MNAPPTPWLNPPEPVSSLIAEWACALWSENKSPNTIRCYTEVARKFHNWAAATLDQPPTEPADVECFWQPSSAPLR